MGFSSCAFVKVLLSMARSLNKQPPEPRFVPPKIQSMPIKPARPSDDGKVDQRLPGCVQILLDDGAGLGESVVFVDQFDHFGQEGRLPIFQPLPQLVLVLRAWRVRARSAGAASFCRRPGRLPSFCPRRIPSLKYPGNHHTTGKRCPRPCHIGARLSRRAAVAWLKKAPKSQESAKSSPVFMATILK